MAVQEIGNNQYSGYDRGWQETEVSTRRLHKVHAGAGYIHAPNGDLSNSLPSDSLAST